MNFFEVLGIKPPRLHLEPSSLEKKFHELSREWHPDRHGGALEAVSRSADLNGAYRTLRDPWKRALYLLSLYRIPLGSKVPPCLAPVYFEMQEAEDHEALLALKRDLERGFGVRDHQLDETFKAFDKLSPHSWATPPQPEEHKVLQLIQELVLENNYAISMLRDLDKKLGTL